MSVPVFVAVLDSGMEVDSYHNPALSERLSQMTFVQDIKVLYMMMNECLRKPFFSVSISVFGNISGCYINFSELGTIKYRCFPLQTILAYITNEKLLEVTETNISVNLYRCIGILFCHKVFNRDLCSLSLTVTIKRVLSEKLFIYKNTEGIILLV